MIFVSSIRPMGNDPNAEHYRNQLAAWKSWSKVASAIVYFNDPEPVLESPITRFIPSENFPRILEMAGLCMCQPEWCVILNGDIVVTERLRSVEERLKQFRAMAAASWRHEFDPAIGLEPRKRVDNGLDFFAAHPIIWARVHLEANENLRLGSIQWDTWLLGFFGFKAAGLFWDITPSRCVCHPKHNGRAYGPAPPPFHFHAWPLMPSKKLD